MTRHGLAEKKAEHPRLAMPTQTRLTHYADCDFAGGAAQALVLALTVIGLACSVVARLGLLE